MNTHVKRKDLSIIILALVAVMVIFVFKSQKKDVKPTPRSAPPQIDYSLLIKTHADQAGRRNLNALKSFEMDINRIVQHHEPKLQTAATTASKEAADYKSCCLIVYYLAYDKVRKDAQTEAYLDSEIKPITDPIINAYASDINAAVDRLDADLRGSTLLMAKDLAALGPIDPRPAVNVDTQNLDKVSFDATLRNLGFNAASLSVAVMFDAVALVKTGIAGTIMKKIASIAARMFGKQVAKVATSAALIPADGPFPVGDILACIGIVWTGYDIYAAQNKFEDELHTSLNNMLADANTKINKQAIEHAHFMLKKYQELQDDIGSQTVITLSGGKP